MVPQRAYRSPRPPNIRNASAATPSSLATEQVPAGDMDVIEVLLSAKVGECLLLTGPGGGGKSTAIEMAAHRAATARADDASKPWPIRIELKEYRHGLDENIHRTLGLSDGSWKSIPGPILLMLDGLNELSAADADAVAAEVRALLREPKHAIIISCRDTGTSRPVVLPGISACWSIAPFTFKQVRELARSLLPDDRTPEFMAHVLGHSGTRAGASLFSLPFVVHALAEIYAHRAMLPSTLGEIVNALLELRYSRNQEIEVSQGLPEIDALTLRDLGHEVAYRLRLVQRKASASRPEIQRIVHEACLALKHRGVFGADALTDDIALTALRRHEYLVVSQSDRFSFRHDLVAGFLAARGLAASWRDHLDTVHDTAAADAWTFALRECPADDRESMMRLVLARDLLLAARGAVEAGLHADAGALLLGMEPPATATTIDVWWWMAACATVATPECLQRLRDILAAGPASSRDFQAKTALVRAGDEALLRELLPMADRMYCRDVRPRGGEEALWREAPPVAALAVARERIKTAADHEYLGATALTLARFGNESDTTRLERLMGRTSTLDTLLYAGDALHAFDPQRAIAAMMAALPRVKGPLRLPVHAWLAHRDGPCDNAWLIDLVLRRVEDVADEWTQEGEDRDEMLRKADHAQLEAAEILRGTSLSTSDRARLTQAFATSQGVTRKRIWSIAVAHHIAEFDEAAFEVAAHAGSGPFDDLGYACNHAAKRDWPNTDHERFIRGITQFLARDDIAWSWEEARALAYLLSRGERELVVTRLEAHLRAWMVEYGGTLRYGDLRSGFRDRLSSFREVIAEVARELPVDLRVRFLRVYMLEDPRGECHRRIIEGLPSELLDAELEVISDPRQREVALARLAPMGRTPGRLTALRAALDHWRLHPVGSEAVLTAAQHLWCDEVARLMIDLVIRDEWPMEFAEEARYALSEVAFRYDRTMLHTILEPALARSEGRVRDLLALWAERARRRTDDDT